MSIEAIKKLASSSKVLLFIVFVIAISVALAAGLVDKEWWRDTLRAAFVALMGGYSVVEAARAVMSGKVDAAKAIMDPASALKEATVTVEAKLGSGTDIDAPSKALVEKDVAEGVPVPKESSR